MDYVHVFDLGLGNASITSVQMLVYTCKLCHSHEFFDCLDREFLNWENFCLKLSTDHSGKFAPREINLLYGSWLSLFIRLLSFLM